MDKQQAKYIIEETFEKPFDKNRFTHFIKNLLNRIDEAPFAYHGQYIPEAYRQCINTLERIGKFNDGENRIDILIIKLQRETSLERARTNQRNFVAGYLQGKYGSSNEKEAALVAFVSPDNTDWRFSLVKMDYKFEQTETGKMKAKEEFTPARRWSFLVGANEKSHTAQSRLVKILANDAQAPTLAELEEAFNIETVTKEFFLKYRNLFIRTKEALDTVVQNDARIQNDFEAKGVNTVDFAKKLLGQIVFLYFLQKKGWFGAGRDADWGDGSKQFLRELSEKKHGSYNNFFNDILEPLFYEALRNDRSHDDDYYSRFNCKIPFLNGGLFDPIGIYDWVHTDIILPDSLFSNKNQTGEGDTGDGILDIFDRYNFTVKEDEPLEKEVAIDPELLGKTYEKFNAIRPDNFEEYKKALKSGKKGDESKFNKQFGVYYTPREIVHYMCRQSLINYLHTELNDGPNPSISKEDIETLIHLGEQISENESTAIIKEQKINEGKQRSTKIKPLLPESIRKNAGLIDRRLADITVCDPAVGSGAFPVGMMGEIVKARTVLTTFIDNKEKRTPYDFKRQCIEHSLYGVDIDPGAVEIAKLRLWLSLVVDEDDIKNIKPLPNLDYKIVCGNSLLSYPYTPMGFEEIEKLKELFIKEVNPTRKNELRSQIDHAIYGLFKNTEKSLGYKVTMDFKINFSEVFHGKDGNAHRNNGCGFNIVIANPPYVSTKGRDDADKKVLLKIYDFADDLYSHFYFRGIEIAADNKGVLCFISSKTFWTIQTKKNLRELFLKNKIIELYDTANPFEAMVDTCVILVKKTKDKENYTVYIKDGKKDLLNPVVYQTVINTYHNTPNKVLFIPHDFNIAVHCKYSKVVNYLTDKWWDKISTSKNVEKNKRQLEEYRKSLKPGDITLLGLITDGGVGLQTGSNGKYVGVLEGTKYAENVRKSRPDKLLEAISSYNIKEINHLRNKDDARTFLESKTEYEIRLLFDELKEKYGRDIFGQGYLFRIVNENEIDEVETLTEDEKENGIAGVRTFVPYDKGDKEGNRWYLQTPYYIDWSRINVSLLKNDPKARWQGYNFYFREGFCWSDIHTILIKSRLKTAGVHDVKSMSLFSLIPGMCPEEYLITILNSTFISEYDFNFLNNTQTFQINDARQIPIIIPTKDQLSEFERVFNEAYQVQKSRFGGEISKNEADKKLDKIQQKVDQMVYKLYGLTEQS